jgi:hypothetical protein
MKRLIYLGFILLASCTKKEVCHKPLNQNYFYYVQSVDADSNIIQSPIVVTYAVDLPQATMTTLGVCDCKLHPEDERCKPMPLNFVSILVLKKDGYNVVRWNVAKESNIEYYSVMRSDDGLNFKEIGKVEAKGLSTYTYKDIFN